MNPELRNRILILGLLCVVILLLDPSPTPRVVSETVQALRIEIQADRYDQALTYSQNLLRFYPEQTQLLLLTFDLATQGKKVGLVQELLANSPSQGLHALELSCYQVLADFMDADPQSKAHQLLNDPQHCFPSTYFHPTLLELLDQGEIKIAQTLASVMKKEALVTPSEYLELGILEAVHSPQKGLASLQLYLDAHEKPSPLAEDLIRAIRQAELEDSEAYSLTQVGTTLIAYGEWALAEEAFRTATELSPDFPEAWAFLGLAVDRSGGNGYAMLARAVGLDESSPLSHSLMAKHWNQAGDYARLQSFLGIPN